MCTGEERLDSRTCVWTGTLRHMYVCSALVSFPHTTADKHVWKGRYLQAKTEKRGKQAIQALTPPNGWYLSSHLLPTPSELVHTVHFNNQSEIWVVLKNST